MLVRLCGRQLQRSSGCRYGIRKFSDDAEVEALARQELAKRAHREVQIARRRRREAEDEIVLYKRANDEGFLANTSDGDDEAQQRRRAIDHYLSARAETVMDVIVAGRPLSEVVDFTLEVAPSRDLPQPIAGDGVFIKDAKNGVVPAGTLLTFYPGSVYMPHEVRWLGGYGPTLDRAGQHTSSHVIGRFGGVRLDGLWSTIKVPAAEYPLDDATLDAAVAARLVAEDVQSDAGRQAANDDASAFREGLLSARRSRSAGVACPSHAGDRARIRALNPLAVGEMVNHPPNGGAANVLGWGVDLNLFGDGDGDERAAYARAAVNSFALRPEDAPAPGAPCPYTVVFAAARDISVGEELFLDYGCELLDVVDIPVWFTPAALRGDTLETDVKAHPAMAIKEELHSWRTDFEKRHGRKPTRQDMMDDPVSSSLFETFQGYRKLGDL